jgi:hypothetical protein
LRAFLFVALLRRSDGVNWGAFLPCEDAALVS